MSAIALGVSNVFLEDQIQEFFNRGLGGATATVNAAFTWLRGRTYVEWYRYFEAHNFQPVLWEAPIMMRVLRALYSGMVIEAEEAAQHWTNLSTQERDQYWQMAVFFLEQKPPSYTLQDRITLFFNSFLTGHNFFQDIHQLYRLTQEFQSVVFSAIARSTQTVRSSTKSVEINSEQIKALYPDLQTYQYMERQGQLFDQMQPQLIKSFGGLFVHFEDGEVLDSDANEQALVKRVADATQPKSFFVEQVLSEDTHA